MLTAAVTLNANLLYMQQRQLQNLGDALALDLADLQAITQAESELEILNTTKRATTIRAISFDAPKVTILLCQKPDGLFELRNLLSVMDAKVCAKSVATTF